MPDLGAPGGSDGEKGEISLTRIYLPFAMVLTVGGFLVVSGYAVGEVISGISHNKTAVEARLTSIEREMTAIKGLLVDRIAQGSLTCRTK